MTTNERQLLNLVRKLNAEQKQEFIRLVEALSVATKSKTSVSQETSERQAKE